MNCNNMIIHIVQPRDTLYILAKSYNTTVDSILNLNPGIEIYNLQVGTKLKICPGQTLQPVPPIGTIPPIEPPVTPVPPIGTIPPITPVPPIGILPPITPIPPIGTIPPVTPVPPIGTLPPIVTLRELLLLILRWIREHFGKDHADRIINFLMDEIGKL